MPDVSVHPLLPHIKPSEARAILGAMRAIAETGGALTDADRVALKSTDRYIFGHAPSLDLTQVSSIGPEALSAALHDPALAEEALKFMTVMAFMDGVLDKPKITKVLDYAQALGIHAHYLDQIAEVARDHIQAVLADMTRCNMESVTNKAWLGGDVNAWLQPYGPNGRPDPALAQRFADLAHLSADTFGYSFWSHFQENGYAFPGAPGALNAAFSVPHDSVHVVAGYDTSPRGELLASTFTASMHRRYPMAGHVLPVILSWHLKIAINDVARDAAGALDPEAFWRAWAAGAETTVDTFAPDWDFWDFADQPLKALRARWSVPEGGVDGVQA
jgi:hypothetical protein